MIRCFYRKAETVILLFLIAVSSNKYGLVSIMSSKLNLLDLLPYFPQLAKVFSQSKYYVGGPRKVQICRNCLLTNTIIMRFCLFIVVINCCLSRNINDTCAPICLFTVTISTRECPSLASSLSKSNTPLCTEMILLVEIQI
jgi:hypothetical protein